MKKQRSGIHLGGIYFPVTCSCSAERDTTPANGILATIHCQVDLPTSLTVVSEPTSFFILKEKLLKWYAAYIIQMT